MSNWQRTLLGLWFREHKNYYLLIVVHDNFFQAQITNKTIPGLLERTFRKDEFPDALLAAQLWIDSQILS